MKHSLTITLTVLLATLPLGIMANGKISYIPKNIIEIGSEKAIKEANVVAAEAVVPKTGRDHLKLLKATPYCGFETKGTDHVNVFSYYTVNGVVQKRRITDLKPVGKKGARERFAKNFFSNLPLCYIPYVIVSKEQLCSLIKGYNYCLEKITDDNIPYRIYRKKEKDINVKKGKRKRK